MIGQLIEKYIVRDVHFDKEYSYKTLRGARRMFDKIVGHASIYQETTCVGEYIEIEAK